MSVVFFVKGRLEMAKPELTVYLADANVLLNLSQLGRLDVLRMCVERLSWRIVVPRCVLNEIDGEVSGQDLVVRGVELAEDEASISMAIVAERARNGMSSSLSETDAELYVRAKREIATVWTDDGPLVRLLKRKGIPQVHTFAPLLKLCELGELGPEDILDCGRRLLDINPRFTKKNLDELVRKVGEVVSGSKN